MKTFPVKLSGKKGNSKSTETSDKIDETGYNNTS